MAFKGYNKLWLVALFTVLLLALSGCVIGEDSGNDTTNIADDNNTNDNNGNDNLNTGGDDNNDTTNTGDDNNDTTNPGDEQHQVETREAALSINVTDNMDQPLAGAKVSMAGTTLETDANGNVRFGNLTPARVVAIVRAEGFAPVSVTADIPEGVEYFHKTQVLPYGTPIAFNGLEGGVVAKDDVMITFPPEGIADKDGNVITGEVQVYIAPLDPSTDDYKGAPGPLMGIPDNGGDAVPFVSVFMAEITLFANGEEVNVRPGYAAEVEFTIPEIFADAYTIGELSEGWWFNLNEGIWYQEGFGTISESALNPGRKSWNFTATHFTWLNHDVSFNSRNCVLVTVLQEGSYNPVPGAMTSTNGTTPGGRLFVHAPSGADGVACVDFPMGQSMDIWAIHPNFKGSSVRVNGTNVSASCTNQQSGECLGATVIVR